MTLQDIVLIFAVGALVVALFLHRKTRSAKSTSPEILDVNGVVVNPTVLYKNIGQKTGQPKR